MEKEEVQIDDSDKRKKPLTLEHVDQAINRYIDEKNVASSFRSLLKNEVKIVGEHTLELQLKNSVEKKFLGEIEVELVKFLRDALENDYVLVSTSFNQAETVRTAYTNAEIFEEMLAKKPELIKLRDELGLDTDF